jgi:tetraacyldisaccharide 4'-kinase
MRVIQLLLLPISFCYGLIMMIRNMFFDTGLIPSKSFEKPVISVGNLSMGGTGKTPHIEYLVRLLKDSFLVATLSRGYGRESNGFILASKKSSYKYIGDEPMQYVRKFDGIKVAVDEKRARGISLLLEKVPAIDLVLLDDAYQHRYVRPGFSILLTEYHHLYPDDHVVPSGTLREFPCGAKRADIILVTKTPKIFSPITRRRILEELKTKENQKVFFTYLKYGDPVPVYDDTEFSLPCKISFLLLFTGIADDTPLMEHLVRTSADITRIKFPDHHRYTAGDIEKIKKKFEDLPTQKKAIFTTEKDVMRLRTAELGNYLKNLPLFYIPIEVEFHGKDRVEFDKAILDYVTKNKRNGRVPRNENHA